MLPEGQLVYCSFRDIGEEIRLKEEGRFRRAQLIHANKMAALGMLVTSVAHEINNPNNFIMHNNQILADVWKDAFPILQEHYKENGDYYLGGIPLSEFEEVIPRLVYGIHDGSERIRNIVQNLRDFVRSDRASLDGTVDLSTVVANAVSLMRSEISRHTGNFIIKCDEDLPLIKGSAQKLEQVVINLVMNALQSLTGHDQRVAITVNRDAGNDQIIFTISDEGEGMPETVKARIMEPFFSTKLDKGGTGLGLYISNSIIMEHKGSISLRIRAGCRNNCDRAAACIASEGETWSGVENRTLPVLLVDDEPQILLSAQTLLRASGFSNVMTLGDSRDVIPSLALQDVGVIILDISMPHISGCELLVELNQDYPHIPVIFMTATNDLETAVSCMRGGAFDYLVKPVERSRFVTAVTRALEMRSLQYELLSLKDRLLTDALENASAFSSIITRSKKMRAIFQYIEVISGTRQPVLITGETGVGKELVARAIHKASGLSGSYSPGEHCRS